DKRKGDRGLPGFARLASQIRRGRYEAAYLAQGSMRSAALALVGRVPTRIGFESSSGRALYTTRVPYVENDHHALRLLSLAGLPDTPRTPPRPRLYPGDAERAEVDALLRGVDSATPLFALAPGSVW